MLKTYGMQRTIGVIGLLCAWLLTAAAQEQEPAAPETEIQAAWKAAAAVMQSGPKQIALRDQAKLQLPDGYAFVPQKEAARLMAAMGNSTDSRFMGLITPLSDAAWFVTVDFEDSGYIKDDDAKNWKVDELLQSLKDGTEEGNKRREQMGIPPITVTRWVESPKYQAETHQLIWSAEARLKNGDDPDPTINYNTYVLGREGYISMDLVTNSSTIDADKKAAIALLSGVAFNDGKRYGDFNSSTDKVAAYGLTALVGGVVAKKLGLLAALGVFLAKFAKLIFIGVAALGGAFVKFFRRDKPASTDNPSA